MGCGRVGSALASSLSSDHDVVIIDQNADAFRRLPQDFTGRTVLGVGFDRETMKEAGCESADAFAAVSSGDNSNILAARVARETFGVENVVARIYDPRRAEVYQRLGIPTVATVPWTTDQIRRRLLPSGAQSEWQDPTGEIVLAEVHVHRGWVGHPVADVEAAISGRVAFITRLGAARLPQNATLLQDGDLVHVLVPTATVKDVESLLGMEPGGHR